ncbi:uncharacterized protein LOC143508114 [Brachyhypopomus gauderio]|uniref:uncharacterized protein LOC143508114 n=1 Tax=Brachyhypopomus gauderio TaxID=698409 RepID=UPI004041B764
MQPTWFFSLAQSVVSAAVIGVSIRLCGTCGTAVETGGVSGCLMRCLGWAGAIGAAVAIPVDVILNLRSPQCLYVCITLVCCPLLVRQFTVGLQLLLTIDAHLKWRLGRRYVHLVTRRQALCLVLLVWVFSVVTAFSQFIVSDSANAWGSVGLGLDGWPNSSSPQPPIKTPHAQDRSVIGRYLPYAGFLSKFLVEDLRNFTYEEIHGDHWAVCAPDAVLSSLFLVGVYAVAVFLVPLLVLLAVFLDLARTRPRRAAHDPAEPRKTRPARSRRLALSVSLLVLLCLPLHATHALRLLAPASRSPVWATSVATFLFQAYALVPPLLFSPAHAAVGEGACLPGTPPSQETTTSSKLKPLGPLKEFCPTRPTPNGKIPVDV